MPEQEFMLVASDNSNNGVFKSIYTIRGTGIKHVILLIKRNIIHLLGFSLFCSFMNPSESFARIRRDNRYTGMIIATMWFLKVWYDKRYKNKTCCIVNTSY